jgi:hypothetical protein
LRRHDGAAYGGVFQVYKHLFSDLLLGGVLEKITTIDHFRGDVPLLVTRKTSVL